MAQYKTKKQAGVKREQKQVVIDRELVKLHKTHGRVKAETVVELAANPEHPLHKYFDWDDSVAAKKWRLQQAHQMIIASKYLIQVKQLQERAVVQVTPTKVPPARRFLPLGRDDGYTDRRSALDDPDTRQRFIESKLNILRHWVSETQDVQELESIRLALETFLADFEAYDEAAE